MADVNEAGDAKRVLRAQMRHLRRALPDRAARSDRLWAHVRALPALARACTVMVFDDVPGEPITVAFVAWCRSAGKVVVLPEDDPPPNPTSIDVVIVPGLAFTVAGERLGQGGGWYDRFLPTTRPNCVTIGVGFEPQILDSLPCEPHDVILDMIVTDAGAHVRCDADRAP